MKVEAIESNDRRYSCLNAVTKGVILGAAGGYAGKYFIPLQDDEKQTPKYRKIINKIHTQKNEYNQETAAFVDSLKFKENKTLAEDKFVRLFDGMKEGDYVKRTSIRNTLKDLQNNQQALSEFRRICKTSSEVAKKAAERCISAYNLATKHLRPIGFFIAAGAVTGAIIGLIGDIIRTDK